MTFPPVTWAQCWPALASFAICFLILWVRWGGQSWPTDELANPPPSASKPDLALGLGVILCMIAGTTWYAIALWRGLLPHILFGWRWDSPPPSTGPLILAAVFTLLAGLRRKSSYSIPLALCVAVFAFLPVLIASPRLDSFTDVQVAPFAKLPPLSSAAAGSSEKLLELPAGGGWHDVGLSLQQGEQLDGFVTDSTYNVAYDSTTSITHVGPDPSTGYGINWIGQHHEYVHHRVHHVGTRSVGGLIREATGRRMTKDEDWHDVAARKLYPKSSLPAGGLLARVKGHIEYLGAWHWTLRYPRRWWQLLADRKRYPVDFCLNMPANTEGVSGSYAFVARITPPAGAATGTPLGPLILSFIAAGVLIGSLYGVRLPALPPLRHLRDTDTPLYGLARWDIALVVVAGWTGCLLIMRPTSLGQAWVYVPVMNAIGIVVAVALILYFTPHGLRLLDRHRDRQKRARAATQAATQAEQQGWWQSANAALLWWTTEGESFQKREELRAHARLHWQDILERETQILTAYKTDGPCSTVAKARQVALFMLSEHHSDVARRFPRGVPSADKLAEVFLNHHDYQAVKLLPLAREFRDRATVQEQRPPLPDLVKLARDLIARVADPQHVRDKKIGERNIKADISSRKALVPTDAPDYDAKTDELDRIQEMALDIHEHNHPKPEPQRSPIEQFQRDVETELHGFMKERRTKAEMVHYAQKAYALRIELLRSQGDEEAALDLQHRCDELSERIEIGELRIS